MDKTRILDISCAHPPVQDYLLMILHLKAGVEHRIGRRFLQRFRIRHRRGWRKKQKRTREGPDGKSVLTMRV